MTPEMVDQMNLDKSLAFYKDRFSDASDFTFVFVGSFDLDTMKPLRHAVPRRAARNPPQGNLEGHRPQEADRHRSKSVWTRGSNRRAAPSSCTPGRSSTTRISVWPFAPWRRCSKSACGNRCAKIWAAPTASPPRQATRRPPARNTPSPSRSGAAPIEPKSSSRASTRRSIS